MVFCTTLVVKSNVQLLWSVVLFVETYWVKQSCSMCGQHCSRMNLLWDVRLM